MSPLLSVKDLKVQFAARKALVTAVRRLFADHRIRRVRRPRGRIGLRQDDDGPRGHATSAHQRAVVAGRSISGRRGSGGPREKEMRSTAAVGRAHPPGPDELAQPDDQDRHARSARDCGSTRARRPRRPASAPSRSSRWSRCPGRPSGSTSTPSSCRAAFASASSSPWAWCAAQAPDRRRAHDGAGRDDPGPDPRHHRQAAQNLNMGVLLITHDMGVIAGRTDRVVVMYAGKKAEEAPRPNCSPTCATPTPRRCSPRCPIWRARTSPAVVHRGLTAGHLQGDRGCRFAPRCSSATDQCRAEDPA